jgi:hypothetical protein
MDGVYQTKEEFLLNSGKGWNFYSNPLDVNHIGSGSRGNYYDYHNPAHKDLVNSLSLSAQWYDYASWLKGIPGVLEVGIGNGIYYNINRVK